MTDVLLSTLPPDWGGGVPRMADFAVRCLREVGLRPIVAWYRPFTEDPGLSVSLLGRRSSSVRRRRVEAFGGLEAWELGAFLPELEFNQYRLTDAWRLLLDRADLLVAVSGNCLAAQPFAEAGRPFLAWVATPWRDDRLERERTFSLSRRLVDSVVVRPVVLRLETDIVAAGEILPLSAYTRDRLRGTTRVELGRRLLPMPIETDLFRPDRARVKPGLVGFVGRLDDPRKRIDRLIQAIALCRSRGVPVEGLLVGGGDAASVSVMVEKLGLEGAVRVVPSVPNSEIPSILREMDVFVIPSDQEGLCIAGLEALASGCPVVSTRCGGPEEYVLDGQTGSLVPGDPEALADAIAAIVVDRARRSRLGAEARALAERRYSPGVARRVFLEALEELKQRRS